MAERDPGFGVVVTASDQDLHLAAATCASVRHFLGDTPIALVFDGQRGLRDVVAAYDLAVITRADVEHDGLRELSFGWGFTKMIAQWLGPFEAYLSVDADAVVWGDVRTLADFDTADFVVDHPGFAMPREGLAQWYFDPDAIARHFPDFEWQNRIYTNPGVFFARRNSLDLDAYLELLEFRRRNPGVFLWGDQGLFNFLLLRAADAGSIRLEQRPLQVMMPWVHEPRRSDFSVVDGTPVVKVEPRILHWPGPLKVHAQRRPDSLTAPFQVFRMQYHRRLRQQQRELLPIGLQLRVEDVRLLVPYARARLRVRAGKLARRLLRRATAPRQARPHERG